MDQWREGGGQNRHREECNGAVPGQGGGGLGPGGSGYHYILSPLPSLKSGHKAAWTYTSPIAALGFSPRQEEKCPFTLGRPPVASIPLPDTEEAISVRPHHSAGNLLGLDCKGPIIGAAALALQSQHLHWVPQMCCKAHLWHLRSKWDGLCKPTGAAEDAPATNSEKVSAGQLWGVLPHGEGGGSAREVFLCRGGGCMNGEGTG